jgi:DtxR family transcriptional regulator, manganese transport regulator
LKSAVANRTDSAGNGSAGVVVGVECDTAPTHASRFGRARQARAASMLEDCTELIADLAAGNGETRVTDIANHLGVAHATASKTIARLKREGLADSKPYRGVFLTEAGKAMAERSRRRHRLVVDFLVAIGTPREAAEVDAEGVEHYVSEATLGAFEAFLKARA